MGQAVNLFGFRLGFTRPWPVQTSDLYGRPDETHFRYSYFYWQLVFYFFRLFKSIKKAARRLRARSKRHASYFSDYFKTFDYSHLRVISFFRSIRLNVFFFQPSLIRRLRALRRLMRKAHGRSSTRSSTSAVVTEIASIFFRKAQFKRVRRRGGSGETRSQIYNRVNFYVSSYRQSKLLSLSPFLYDQAPFLLFRLLFFFYYGSFFTFMARLVKKFTRPFFSWFRRKCKVTFYPIKYYWHYPVLVVRYFSRRVRRRQSPMTLVQPIRRSFFSGLSRYVKNLRRRLYLTLPLAGIRLKVAGRWTRQQMGQLFKKTYGRVSASSQSAPIDCSFLAIRLKNSSVGISIAIQSTRRVLSPEYRFFKTTPHLSKPFYGFLVSPKTQIVSTVPPVRKKVTIRVSPPGVVFKTALSYFDYFKFPKSFWINFSSALLFKSIRKKATEAALNLVAHIREVGIRRSRQKMFDFFYNVKTAY